MKSQLAQYQLDNMTILDIMMNTLSAAEKLVFRDKEGKKYAYYDEGNSAEWKDTYQLVKELQIQKECLQSMIQLYNKNSNKNFFEFPCNLSKEQIIEDLILLRDQAMILYQNNYMIKSIYNDIISVIDCKKCPHYTVEQIYSKEKNNILVDKPKKFWKRFILLIFSDALNSFVIGKNELLFLPLIYILISNLKALFGLMIKHKLFQSLNLIASLTEC